MTNDQIKYGLEKRRLKLSIWDKMTHYELVVLCSIFPLTYAFIYLRGYFLDSTKLTSLSALWFFILPSLLGILFFYLQKNRLKFKEVRTNLTDSELNDIIDKVAEELEWDFKFINSKAAVAKTSPGFLSGSWGEQITILFGNKRVLVNSICDLDKRHSLASMGRNSQNENRLIEEIKKASS